MRFLLLVVALVSSLSASVHGHVARNAEVLAADEVCFDKLGCFGTSSPWTSTIRPRKQLPQPPHEVGTRFLLFTRNDGPYDQTGYELVADKDAILEFSLFDSSKRTVFLIHGFTDSGSSAWVVNARKGFLEKEDINLIVVDWKAGAKSPYLSATANSRVVGAQISYFIDYLVEKAGLRVSDVQLVGHSLGAHVAGYAGSRQGGELPHITALDPIDPYFGGTDPMVRLDSSDAKFVEVVHTNAQPGLEFGLGYTKSAGHVDIYPNGGKSQPGCKDLLGNLVSSILNFITLDFEGAIGTWACSHARVVDFYVESITSQCPFVSYSCSSYNEFKKGNCYSECSSTGSCFLLGYGSERLLASTSSSRPEGDFYLNTADKNSYCLQVAHAEASVSQNQPTTTGKVTLQLRTAEGSTEKFVIADGKIKGGDVINQWIEVPSKFTLGGNGVDKPVLVLHYKRGGLLPTTQPKQLSLNSINIYLTDKNLNTQRIQYSEVTLEAGTDIQIGV